MSDESSSIENISAAMVGLIRVCQALAKERDAREGGTAWRELLETELIEETKSTMGAKHIFAHRDPVHFMLVLEGIRMGLTTDPLNQPMLRSFTVN